MHARFYPSVLFRVLLASVPVSFALHLSGADLTDPAELKAQAERWIDLEKRAADERNAWRSDKDILAASVEVLKRERTTLQTRLESNELAATAFKGRLDKAQTELTEHEVSHRALTEGCAEIERRISALQPRLPAVLQDRLAPMLAKLQRPSDDEPVAVSERAQTLVSVLTAIDQFNNTLSLTHELRPNGSGETHDVKVLYWGLAMAYALNATGSQAWIVAPGAGGWEWQEAPAETAAIKILVDTYEKQKSPEFVVLPVRAEGGRP